MSGESNCVHMVQLALHADRLFSLARSRRLPTREVDTGYVVHALLRGLFGEDAPQPFAMLPGKGRIVPVLGYALLDDAALRRRADEYAAPEAHAAVDWSRFAAKPMPVEWSPGRRLGFRLRACPTVRMAKAGPHHAAGAEVDVFLAKCWATGNPEQAVDREVVYRDWLAAQLERRGGARLARVAVSGFQLEPLMRRTQAREGDRKARVLRKPEVTFDGELEVVDGPGFAALLRRGVGRHRAFGFGMLLLRPQRPC